FFFLGSGSDARLKILELGSARIEATLSLLEQVVADLDLSRARIEFLTTSLQMLEDSAFGRRCRMLLDRNDSPAGRRSWLRGFGLGGRLRFRGLSLRPLLVSGALRGTGHVGSTENRRHPKRRLG